VERKALSGDFSVPHTASILSALKVLRGQRDMNEAEFAKVNGTSGQEQDLLCTASEQSVDNGTDLTGHDVAMDSMPVEVYAEEDCSKHLNASQIAMNNDAVITQKVAMPQELAHLSRDFEDDVIEAASAFGLEAIRAGKELVASELKSAGFKNAQVKFGSESNQSVIYLAAINTPKGPAEIEVALEMNKISANKYMPLMPTYFAYDGLIEDFTPAKLQRFAMRLPAASTKTTIYSTAFSYMLLTELKDEMLKAASESDYVTCETILDEVKNRFNEDDYRNAIADYHHILTCKAKLNAPQYKCSRLIPAGKTSISARCGHYNCSIDKVVTDENGNCRLKTSIEREKLNPIEDGGACISTSKINLT
jgi:hypothetical protein